MPCRACQAVAASGVPRLPLRTHVDRIRPTFCTREGSDICVGMLYGVVVVGKSVFLTQSCGLLQAKFSRRAK